MSDEKNPIVATLFALFLIGLTLFSFGLSYRGLRFMANYQEDVVTIIDCERTLHETRDLSYFNFEMQTAELPYPITRTEGAETSFADAIRFRDPKPTKDWCALVGHRISVFHFDKLEVAIPYDGDSREVGAWSLFLHALRMETAGAIWMVPLLALLAAGALVVLGIGYFITVLSDLDFSVTRRQTETTIAFIIRYINHRVGLLVTVILAASLVIGLGLALVKGMLYVESSNSLLAGTTVLVGLGLASFGPALIFQGVHRLRNTESEAVAFVRNLVLMAGLGKLTVNIWTFVAREDLGQLSVASSWGLMRQILLALFS